MKPLWRRKGFWIRVLVISVLFYIFYSINVSWCITALVVSFVFGHCVTWILVEWMHCRFGITPEWIASNFDFGLAAFPRSLLGIIEQLFFMVLVAADVSGVATGMMTWILIKMVSNWNLISQGAPPKIPILYEKSDIRKARLRRLGYSGMLGTLVSLFFASLGGLIWKKQFCLIKFIWEMWGCLVIFLRQIWG